MEINLRKEMSLFTGQTDFNYFVSFYLFLHPRGHSIVLALCELLLSLFYVNRIKSLYILILLCNINNK